MVESCLDAYLTVKLILTDQMQYIASMDLSDNKLDVNR
jgi:hypothetical protein